MNIVVMLVNAHGLCGRQMSLGISRWGSYYGTNREYDGPWIDVLIENVANIWCFPPEIHTCIPSSCERTEVVCVNQIVRETKRRRHMSHRVHLYISN